ncbi:cytochrome C oxidase subunit II [Aurantiacibacter luteus]|uniref:Cytochrome c oxidase subunit 2 n=1 Tax=Aurantiacibacter luteus TaxID=1581420 RepID=A0A0G9MZH5_9SPHN|nr:cytochrome C oxidase subunit II [Aurantiacibacter luteus]
MLAAFAFVSLPQAGFAQAADPAVAEVTDSPNTDLSAASEVNANAAENRSVAEGEVVAGDEAGGGFQHFGPEMIKGQPEAGAYGFQPQYSDNGRFGLWMHDAILMPIITIISFFVLGLLMWVVFRYNKRANQVPSKTSHNTLIEVIWTVLPVLILVGIAVPSITLLARQYESPPENAITIKANGYQWYWGYEYVDNGGFEVISNMLDEAEALDAGEPHQLAVDNRMVVPVGVPIRLQTFGSDVIHSFGIPSLWFKLDAVPGRINELMLTIDEPGIYYGQCMELCGALHGFMPIAIEARTLEDYNAWVQTQPGGMTVEQVRAQAAQEAAAAAAPAAAEDAAEQDGPAAEEENAEVAASEGQTA